MEACDYWRGEATVTSASSEYHKRTPVLISEACLQGKKDKMGDIWTR